LVPGARVFEGNLYPLGKPSRGHWPVGFQTLFGFGDQDRDNYLRHVEETRFKAFAEMKSMHHPQAILCYGKGDGGKEWKAFAKVFASKLAFRELSDGKIRLYAPIV
jgi:hypothetical protein